VKENIAEILEKELSRKSWKGEVVNIGGVTDSYQPLEREMKLMPKLLRLFIKYRTPIIISTKSDLILRDIDLIAELAEIADVYIAATITTPNEKIREKIEPGASSSIDRFRMLEEIGKTKAATALHLMPIIPYLTDNPDDLETLFMIAANCDVKYIVTGKLSLRGKTKPHFLSFMRNAYEEEFLKLIKLYNQKERSQEAAERVKSYNHRLTSLLKHLRIKYQMTAIYKPPENRINTQLKLFG